jgi:hypothetical protein
MTKRNYTSKMPKRKSIDITKEIERIVLEHYEATGYIVRDIECVPFMNQNEQIVEFYVTIKGEYE